MNKELKLEVDSWKIYRKLTLDLLDLLPEDKLKGTVGKNMGSLGKQFRHIGDVQHCYNEAIRTGKIDFNKYKRDYSIENSKEKLKEFLEEVDKEMFELIENNKDIMIDWGFDKFPISEHLRFLTQHEIFHVGELVVYIRSLELRFPKSWEEIFGELNIKKMSDKWKGNNIIAIFKDKKFEFLSHDKSTWKDVIEYGKSIGIPEEELDFPVD